MVKWIIDMALGGPRRGGEGLGGKVIWVVCIVLAELEKLGFKYSTHWTMTLVCFRSHTWLEQMCEWLFCSRLRVSSPSRYVTHA